VAPIVWSIRRSIRSGFPLTYAHTHSSTPRPQQAALQTPGPVVVEGEMKIGGQEHFYLEPNATLAIPGEVSKIWKK
jgi:xanthine dehydrogenase molybdopterin-binding subunit B